MTKVGTIQDFCLTFIVNLKNNNLLKKVLKWANKKCKNFNTYSVVLKKKERKKEKHLKILFHTCVPKILMIWYSSWDTEWDGLELVIMVHFLPFYSSPPKNLKNQKFEKKKEKNCCDGDIIILHTHVHQKITITWGTVPYEVQFLRYRVRQTEFFVILYHFLTFYHLTSKKIEILKKWKKHLEMSSVYTCVP